MNERCDVLVIGGGVIGVCAACYLAERGRQVTLVERGDIAAGCSYGNAGLIVPSHCAPLAEPGALASGLRWMLDPESPFYVKPRLDPGLIGWLLSFAAHCTRSHVRRSAPVLRDLGTASIALYDQLAAQSDLSFGYARKGLLFVYRTADGLRRASEEAGLLAGFGVKSRALTPTEACALEPTVRPDLAGGLYFPFEAHLNPAGFVQGLARLVARKGVRIEPHNEVLGFETSARKVTSVKTARGKFLPAEVVLAAGSWSPALAAQLRVRLPIQPAKGYSITVKRPSSCPTTPLLLGEARVGVTPMESPTGAMLRFAGTLELAGLDLSINPRRVNAIRRAATDYLSGMDKLETIEVWAGLRPCTPDGLPVIGRPGAFENLTIATGHAMVGMALGPITGKLVAQLVCDEKPELDVRPLSPDRF